MYLEYIIPSTSEMKTKESRFSELSNVFFSWPKLWECSVICLFVDFLSHLPADIARYSFVTPVIIFVTKKSPKKHNWYKK